MFFFVIWRYNFMRNIQLLGLFLLVVGSFLPLLHIPLIGNWNYWKVDHNLAIVCWVFSGFALMGIIFNKQVLVKFSAIILLLLFVFTIIAVKFKSLDYFSFLPFKSWQENFAGIVKLSWGWFLEFSGAILLLLAKKNQH